MLCCFKTLNSLLRQVYFGVNLPKLGGEGKEWEGGVREGSGSSLSDVYSIN